MRTPQHGRLGLRRLQQQQPDRLGVDLPPLPVGHGERRHRAVGVDRGQQRDRPRVEQAGHHQGALVARREDVAEQRAGGHLADVALHGQADGAGARRRAPAEAGGEVAGEPGQLAPQAVGHGQRQLERQRRRLPLQRGEQGRREAGHQQRRVAGHLLAEVARAQRGQLAEVVTGAEVAHRQLLPPPDRAPLGDQVEVAAGVGVAVDADPAVQPQVLEPVEQLLALGRIQQGQERRGVERRPLPGIEVAPPHRHRRGAPVARGGPWYRPRRARDRRGAGRAPQRTRRKSTLR